MRHMYFSLSTLAMLLVSSSPVMSQSMSIANCADRSPGSRNTLLRDRGHRTAIQQVAAASRPYRFTVTLPEQSGRRFSRLSFTFTQQNPSKNIAPIQFNLSATQAFVGSSEGREEAIAIDSAWIDETGIVWVELKPALPSKTTLTIILQSPDSSSGEAYDYGIAAYPDTKPSVAVFVKNGVLTPNL